MRAVWAREKKRQNDIIISRVVTMKALEIFVSKHLELLKLEQESEVEESQKLLEGCSPKDLQSKGVALLGLVIASRKTGQSTA